MPWFSYHGGHSGQFCRHAEGDLRAVVERAISSGFTHYGVSEHCPRGARWLFEGEEDLTPGDLVRIFHDYAAEAARLRDEHADRIDLAVGFEGEMLPRDGWAEHMRALRSDGAFEYMVGSVHNVGDRWVDLSPEVAAEAAREQGGCEALQVAYFDAVATLVGTLRPEVVGHIDLVRKFDGASASFSTTVWPAIERALESALAADAVLDVNPGAHRRGLSPVYPLPCILERAREMGLQVTLGDDGHGPEAVGVGLDACIHAIAAAGYREVSYFAHRDGTLRRLRAPLDEVAPRVAPGR